MNIKNCDIQLNLTKPMWESLHVLESLFKKHRYELLITSGSENFAKHKINSRHYSGNAVDIRSWNIPLDTLKTIGHESRTLLPNCDYVIESNHIHFEYDPKDK